MKIYLILIFNNNKNHIKNKKHIKMIKKIIKIKIMKIQQLKYNNNQIQTLMIFNPQV